LFSCHSVYSQNLVEELKKFYTKADLGCYIDKAQKNLLDDHLLRCQMWGIDTTVLPAPKIDLHREKLIPMLKIKFVNTEKYNYNDDIYNFITIDSVVVFTFACIDKQKNVKYFINFFDGEHAYIEIKRLKNAIKNIIRKQPDMFLHCSTLEGGFGDIFNNGFMYVKGDKIYVYNVNKKKSYELNYYFRTFFRLNDIYSLQYVSIPSTCASSNLCEQK
jgi:hypothetical protein